MARVPPIVGPVSRVSQTVAKNEQMAKILVHSAFDLSDSLYDFASWLGDDSFVSNMVASPDKDRVSARHPGLEIKKPIVFADYNGNNQCMGIGL